MYENINIFRKFSGRKLKTLPRHNFLNFQWNSMKLVPEDAQRYSTLGTLLRIIDFQNGFRENPDNVPDNYL